MSKLFDTWFHDMTESGDTKKKQIEYLKTKGIHAEGLSEDTLFELFARTSVIFPPYCIVVIFPNQIFSDHHRNSEI